MDKVASVITCKTCGTKYDSPIPLGDNVVINECPNCRDIQELMNCTIVEFRDRIEVKFSECVETKQPAELIFNRSSGLVVCRSWKKCSSHCKGRCMVPDFQEKVIKLLAIKRFKGSG